MNLIDLHRLHQSVEEEHWRQTLRAHLSDENLPKLSYYYQKNFYQVSCLICNDPSEFYLNSFQIFLVFFTEKCLLFLNNFLNLFCTSRFISHENFYLLKWNGHFNTKCNVITNRLPEFIQDLSTNTSQSVQSLSCSNASS